MMPLAAAEVSLLRGHEFFGKIIHAAFCKA
jgi:hypothetical protein